MASRTSIRGFGGADACVRQVLRQANHLITAAQRSGTVQWVLDEPQAYTQADIPGGQDNSVTRVLLGYDPAVPIVPPAVLPTITDVETVVVVDPGFTAQVTVNYNLRYQTGNAAAPHPLPTQFEGAPFLVEVQDMVVDPDDTTLLIPDPDVPAEFYLLPYTSFNLPGTGASYKFNNGERLLLGPYSTQLQPRYVRFRLVWYLQGPGIQFPPGTDPEDWNQLATQLDGWAVSPYTNPFPNLVIGDPGSLPIPLTRPPGIEFDVRFG
jgi:hypothetical protein